MSRSFYGCENLNITATDVPNLSSVMNMRSMFMGATSMNADLSNWDTSAVIYIGDSFNNDSGMFYGASAFNQNISTWNTSSVIYMRGMFRDATAFNQDLSSWDVTNVSNFTFFDANTPSWLLPKPTFP